MTPKDSTETLYSMLQARNTPEQVAKQLLLILPDLSQTGKGLLHVAASARAWSFSSMMDDFRRPETHMDRQLALVPALFGVAAPADAAKFAAMQTESWGLPLDRRSKKSARRLAGVYKNARWFNKRRRLLATLQRKTSRLAAQEELYLFTRVSKAALSVEIPHDLFAADLNTAALVTYLAARMNRRSAFTNKAQDRAFDEIASYLLARCEESETTRWFAVAHVLPDRSVLARLTDAELGYLVGRWYALLFRMADWLGRIWRETEFDRAKMIVARGNDSSTWNAVAGAWNRAREHWVSLTYAMSGEALLSAVCPGKVMRLMAADVARWHQASGGDVHPDTAAWASLPPPWDVLTGRAQCGLEEIRIVCARTGADFRSWTFRAGRDIVPFTPTPELVHGVEVASPDLARLLRKAGVFSGKALSGPVPDFHVERDEHGAALLVSNVLSGSSNRAAGSAFRQDEE